MINTEDESIKTKMYRDLINTRIHVVTSFNGTLQYYNGVLLAEDKTHIKLFDFVLEHPILLQKSLILKIEPFKKKK